MTGFRWDLQELEEGISPVQSDISGRIISASWASFFCRRQQGNSGGDDQALEQNHMLYRWSAAAISLRWRCPTPPSCPKPGTISFSPVSGEIPTRRVTLLYGAWAAGSVWRPKLLIVAKLRERLVISRRLEHRQNALQYCVDRRGCVPHVEVDRI